MSGDKYLHHCDSCLTRCDGKSNMVYNFEMDVKLSEGYENLLIEAINSKTDFDASKCDIDGYPDIIIKKNSKAIKYIEVKVQRRTFMKVEEFFPEGGLKISSTVALNLSDLLRYFKIAEESKESVVILWFLMNRPCITGDGVKIFANSLDKLKKVYDKYTDKRRYRRQSGVGDIVNGKHKGVVVNYHFNLNELEEVDLDKIKEWCKDE